MSNWNFFQQIVRGKLGQFSVLDEPLSENGDEEVETKADGDVEVTLHVCGVGYGKTFRNAYRSGARNLFTLTECVRILEEQLRGVERRATWKVKLEIFFCPSYISYEFMHAFVNIFWE